MRAEYLSQLEDILKLRREDNTVRKYSSLSKKSIDNISQTLLTDHILINNFVRVAKETASSVRLIDCYSHTSLDEINNKFVGQSNKIKSIWDDFTTIEAYLTSQELFKGLADKLKENKEKYTTSKNIKEVEKHHKLVSDLLNDKDILDKVVKDVQGLSKILDALPIFKELQAVLQEQKNSIVRATTVATINSHHVWFVDLIKRKSELEHIDHEIRQVEEYLTSQQLFDGLADKLRKNKEKCSASRSIEEIQKHHKLVIDLLNDEEVLDKVVKDVQGLSKILDVLPIFKGLQAVLQEYKNSIVRATTVATINSHHVWFVDLIKRKSELEYIDHEIRQVEEYLTNQQLFDGLADKLRKNKEKCSASRSIEEIQKHYKLVIDLLNDKEVLDKVVKDVQELSKILDVLPIFKGLQAVLQEYKNSIVRATTVATINNHHVWFVDLIKRKNELEYIDREINNFRIFISHNLFFKQHKWIASLENKCANAKESTGIQQLHTNTKKRRQLLDAVAELSYDWGDMMKYCSTVYDKSTAEKYCNKDKEDIIRVLSLLENDSQLDDSKVKKIQEQISKKKNKIMELKNRTYPLIPFWSLD